MKSTPPRLSVLLCLAVALNGCGQGITPVPTAAPATRAFVATPTSAPTSTPTLVPKGTTIIVTVTDDSGPGSLRAALLRAQPGDTITFDQAIFPPEAPAVIALLTPFSLLTQGNITVDGTDAGVVLDGSQVSGQFKSGIEIQSDNNVVRGLHLVHFPGPGLGISGGRGNLIEGNVLGANEFGTGLWGSTATDNQIRGNFVGVLADGITPQGNTGAGIFAWEGAHGNHLGPGNVVAFNQGTGVEVNHAISTENIIFENSIHDNGGSGIGLAEGGNENLAAPRLMGFDLSAGSLDGTACPKCEVLVYSDALDQGAQYEGRTVADAQGTFYFEKGAPFVGPAVTSTAIDAAGNTSGFSLPAWGDRRSVALQAGNAEPRRTLVAKPSDDLEDNGIGGLWSALWRGEFADGIEYEIVPLGLKRVRIAFTENEYISTGAGDAPIDWARSEMPVPPEMAAFVPQLLSHGITIDCVLTFWDKANHPQGWQVKPRFTTQEEIDHYLEYVRYMASTFKGKVEYYELWNEPHLQDPLQYIRVDDYIKVAKLAIPLIHGIDPDAKVGVGAAVTPNPAARDYFLKILNSDVMPMADVVSWHPFYGDFPGGGQYPSYYSNYPSLLNQIMTTATEHGFNGEYIADELTFSGPGCQGCGAQESSFSEVVAAKYTARVVLLHRGSNVIAGIGGISSSRGIHYSTVQNLANVLAGAQAEPFDVHVETDVPEVRVFTFDRSDGSRLAAIWNDGPAGDEDPGVLSTVSIPGHADWHASGIDILNGFEQDLIQDGHAELLTINDFLLKDYPIVIRLSK